MARVLSPSHSLNPPRGRSVSGCRNIATARAPVSALERDAAAAFASGVPSTHLSATKSDATDAIVCAIASAARWRIRRRMRYRF